jgi:hypothetical protein
MNFGERIRGAVHAAQHVTDTTLEVRAGGEIEVDDPQAFQRWALDLEHLRTPLSSHVITVDSMTTASGHSVLDPQDEEVTAICSAPIVGSLKTFYTVSHSEEGKDHSTYTLRSTSSLIRGEEFPLHVRTDLVFDRHRFSVSIDTSLTHALVPAMRGLIFAANPKKLCQQGMNKMLQAYHQHRGQMIQ